MREFAWAGEMFERCEADLVRFRETDAGALEWLDLAYRLTVVRIALFGMEE